MLLEIIKFVLYSALIVLISKYMLVKTIEKLAQSLNLKAKTTGNIAGAATSVPEFLTITTSSLRGLAGASIYNILSSNIINLILYLLTIIFNKNIKKLKNRAIITDIVLVSVTIIIPIVLLRLNVPLNTSIIPIFIILYIFFLFINNSVHNLYLKVKEEAEEKQEENNNRNKKKFKIIKYILVLIITGVLLFFVGELLGDTINILCRLFKVPEFFIGLILGFITSLPEMITFLEAQRHHKKSKDNMLGVVEATNNLLSSNILNLFIIQAIGIILVNIRY